MKSPFSEGQTEGAEGTSSVRLTLRPEARQAAEPLTAAALKSENQRLREEIESLRRLALHDPLTGLQNRRAFDQRLADELARHARFGPPVSVMLVDVDDFKRVNDRWGHAKGDEVLVWVAAFLVSQLRSIDVVCRLGGDEFAVILPGTDEPGALHCAGRLRGILEGVGRGARQRVRLSIGTGSTRSTRANREALLADADAAMYRDKRRRGLSPGRR
jgi:diguanylate cyclase (GGDEF)-like protein